MSAEGFAAVVRSSERGAVIELSGTVNRAAKEGLGAAYEKAAASPGEVLLDFSNVDYINSTGIAVIVGVLALARASDHQIGAVGLTDHYREVFEITRLSDFMHLYENASSAKEEGIHS